MSRDDPQKPDDVVRPTLPPRNDADSTATSPVGPHHDDGLMRDAKPDISIEGYDILRELSRGAQGVVYQAIQKSTHRKVAVKVLLEGPLWHRPRPSVRFEREVELVSHLKHTQHHCRSSIAAPRRMGGSTM